MSFKLPIKQFRAGKKLDLDDCPTKIEPFYSSDDDYEVLISQYHADLAARQSLLYADGRYSLLLVLQGMDTAGKDGAISHVTAGLNPQGCMVSSFKAPSHDELAHDFLWRAQMRLPPRGWIGIFNRSYYEEVLVVRVHPELLAPQHLPDAGKRVKKDFWQRRFKDIRQFEGHLARNGTVIIKCFLHLSANEQRDRLLSRLEDESKQWKLAPQDFRERTYFDQYTSAYQDCLRHTSDDAAPWYVIPADDKKNARLILSQILLTHLKDLPLQYPALSAEQKAFIAQMKLELKTNKKFKTNL